MTHSRTEKTDIVLIFPPIRTWDQPRNFPTGLGLIASILRRAGYRVGVIDANGLRLGDEQVLDQIQQYQPEFIGIGGLITTYGWVKRITAKIKKQNPRIPIILGGSVGTSILETALKNLSIDAVAVGEADRTVLDLMSSSQWKAAAGLAILQDGQVHRTASQEPLENLDELPHPAWDLFPMDVYLRNPVVGVGRDIDIISSRGCPFDCRYCYRLFGNRFRARSAEHVVEEIRQLKQNYDVDFISFQDDCFVVNKKRVYEICDLMDQYGLSRSLRWSCTGRVTVCDPKMLRRMRESGCVSVSYGIESGSDRILQAMGKRATIQQARQAIENTRAAGLRCPVSFMIGYPGETRESVMETVEFCRQMNIPLSSLMFTCPYPGTALYEQVKDQAFFRQQFATEEEFVLRLGDAVDFTVNLTDIDGCDLQQLRIEAIERAQRNYIAPTAEDIQRQERELYGDRLYQKAQQQITDPSFQSHRRRHGFNEKATQSVQQ